MTLVELTVVIGVISFVLVGLCEMYFAVSREWERQQGQGAALDATSQACARLNDYISQATDALPIIRPGQSDCLAVNLPADQAHGIYVPAPSGGELLYRTGTWILFYLSDSTGGYTRNGNILWCGTIPSPAQASTVVPDSNWSLYGNGAGKITPISSMQFSLDASGLRKAVTATVTSAYTINQVTRGQGQLQQNITVCLSNNGPE